ncbi:MAG: glycosyltransferase family 39 protein, partial [Chthoniobacterales bacterium]
MQPAIRNFALLFLGTVLFNIAGSWTLPLIDRDEPRFAEASREMLQRGDYVVPYFNNRFRFDKPPLTYWCQSASYRVFGENDFAARLPSAIAAALTAVVLLAWGRRVGKERVGWWAALIFSLCLQTFIHARAAVADMWLVLFMTAAHWAGYELLRSSLGEKHATSNVQRSTFNEQGTTMASRWWWIFYVALALGFLAKGPIGWMPLLTLGVVRFMAPDLRVARRFHFFAGMLLAFLLVGLWGIPALWRTEGLFLDVGIGKHVVGRSFVAMEGHGGGKLWSYLATLPFYFVLIFVSFAPWSIKLPWLAKKLWRQCDAVDCYLIAGVAMIFVVFTLVKTKLPHYTLPAIPLLALLMAKALAGLPESRRFVRRTVLAGGVAALLALAVTPVAAHFSPTLQLLDQARGDLRREMEIGALD